MSYKATSIVWEYYPEDGGEMMTALALADHADPIGNNIYPSIARVAAMTRQSERTVQYHIKAMIEAGWLIPTKRQAGRGKTTTYRMPLAEITQGLVERVQKLHPLMVGDLPEGCNPAPERVQKTPRKGATAIAPELKRTTTTGKEAKGAGAPSATALAFKAYTHGIQERYGAAYPPSAKANGQLANVVARVGGDNAVALVQYYLACPNPFYPKTRHSLDYLVRDCERLFIDMQAAAGKPPPDENGNPPKPAWAEVVLIDAAEKEVFHSTGKTGDPDRIAGYCTQKFASEIRRKKATHLVVRQGGEEKRYSIAELMNHQGNA